MWYLYPILWFYFLVFSLPFVRFPSVQVMGVHIIPSLIIGIIFIILVAAENPRFFIPRTPTARILCIFLFICLLSSLGGVSVGRSLMVTSFTAYVFLLALAISSITRRVDPRKLLWALGWSAGAACLYGLFQYFGDLRGLPLNVTGLKAAYSGQIFGFARIQAWSLEPLYFANYLLLPISVILGVGSFIRRFWLLGILFMVTLMLTLSRGGVLALVLIMVGWLAIFLFWKMYRPAGTLALMAAISLVLTAGILLIAVPSLKYQAPAEAQAQPSVSASPAPLTVYSAQIGTLEVGKKGENRGYTRSVAWQAFLEHPIMGVGPGGFGTYLHRRDSAYPAAQTVNNEYFELLAETGVFGFLTLFLFSAVLILQSVRVLRSPQVIGSALGWAALLYLVAVGVQYYSFSTLYIPHIWVAVGILMGLNVNQHRQGVSDIMPL